MSPEQSRGTTFDSFHAHQNTTQFIFRNFLMGFLNGSPWNLGNAARFAFLYASEHFVEYGTARHLGRLLFNKFFGDIQFFVFSHAPQDGKPPHLCIGVGASWSSIDRTCLFSTSVLLRAYRK